MMICCEFTHCRDVKVSWAPGSTVATHARWQVDLNSSKIFEPESEEVEVAREGG